MGILDEILVSKADEVTMLRRPDVRDLLVARALEAPSCRSFRAELRRPDGRVGVIGELKRRSPSKGLLAPDLDPAVTAAEYATGGAHALSVLTDGPFFDGRIEDLEIARDASGLPALRKDFVIDEIQIYESRAVGADAILLIAAAVPDPARFADLRAFAVELGLDVLVEIHDARELETALAAGADTVGINNRSLQSFEEDLRVGERLVARVPSDVVAIAESAVRSSADARRMAEAGFDALLVGEALVRSQEPKTLVAQMVEHKVGART